MSDVNDTLDINIPMLHDRREGMYETRTPTMTEAQHCLACLDELKSLLWLNDARLDWNEEHGIVLTIEDVSVTLSGEPVEQRMLTEEGRSKVEALFSRMEGGPLKIKERVKYERN